MASHVGVLTAGGTVDDWFGWGSEIPGKASIRAVFLHCGSVISSAQVGQGGRQNGYILKIK